MTTRIWSLCSSVRVDAPKGVELAYYGEENGVHLFEQTNPETNPATFFKGYGEEGLEYVEYNEIVEEPEDRLNRSLGEKSE